MGEPETATCALGAREITGTGQARFGGRKSLQGDLMGRRSIATLSQPAADRQPPRLRERKPPGCAWRTHAGSGRPLSAGACRPRIGIAQDLLLACVRHQARISTPGSAATARDANKHDGVE